jgi:hypothetical protein
MTDMSLAADPVGDEADSSVLSATRGGVRWQVEQKPI